MISIPLDRPDLTESDAQGVLARLNDAPFADPAMVRRWELAWETLWQRPAVAFTTPGEVLRTLKKVMGWPGGASLSLSPLLHPAWQEGAIASHLEPLWQEVDPLTGGWTESPGLSACRAWVIPHPLGLPVPLPQAESVMEEVSGLVRPVQGTGYGWLQTAWLDGNGILATGGCMLMGRDESLITALAQQRRHLPSAFSCSLGLSQMARLESLLARRRELAEGYLALRDRGLFRKPPNGVREWGGFFVSMQEPGMRQELEEFLRKGGIGASGVTWHAPAGEEGEGMTTLRRQGLRLPLYASLEPVDHKRIINRLHRWAERRVKQA